VKRADTVGCPDDFAKTRGIAGKASRLERSPDSEAEIDDPEAGGESQPEGRAGKLRGGDPGAAAGDTAAAVSFAPGRTIGGRSDLAAIIIWLN
jgi:hypothetical protein